MKKRNYLGTFVYYYNILNYVISDMLSQWDLAIDAFSIGACIANKTQRFRGGINISRIINDDMIPVFSESHTDSPADSSAAACN